ELSLEIPIEMKEKAQLFSLIEACFKGTTKTVIKQKIETKSTPPQIAIHEFTGLVILVKSLSVIHLQRELYALVDCSMIGKRHSFSKIKFSVQDLSHKARFVYTQTRTLDLVIFIPSNIFRVSTQLIRVIVRNPVFTG